MARGNKLARLTLADQRKLAQLAARPDMPKIMDLRVRYLDWLAANFDWLMEQYKHLVEHGDKEADIRGKLIMSTLDRIAPTLRETTQGIEAQPNAARNAGMQIKIYNVNRGTGAARKEAIQIEATKREAFEARAVAGDARGT